MVSGMLVSLRVKSWSLSESMALFLLQHESTPPRQQNKASTEQHESGEIQEHTVSSSVSDVGTVASRQSSYLWQVVIYTSLQICPSSPGILYSSYPISSQS